MISQYLEELEQEPYNVDDFIERLTWRCNNEMGTDNFDPDILHDTFTQTIADLKILQDRQQKKCERLETALEKEQSLNAKQFEKLIDRHKMSIDWFYQLDEKINSVAGKIIHLGEQLENVNTPRSRTVEAQRLLIHMVELMVPGPIINDIFLDKSKLYEAADIIQKLYSISLDLPQDKFADAKKNIQMKYAEIECSLIEEFATAQKSEDIKKMKEIATIMSHFKGYSQCIDAFIEQSQMKTYGGKDFFVSIVPMCEHNYKIIKQIFTSPEEVMRKFILNIYHPKLSNYCQTRLEDRRNNEVWLKTLSELYSRVNKLSTDLMKFIRESDDDLLFILTNKIFAKYLQSYMEVENQYLHSKFSSELAKYYKSKNHLKKQTERFHELRRDVQAFIGNRANIAQIEDYGGETFLSEELAINLLQESKAAFKRCRLLSNSNELPGNVVTLSDILLRYLIVEHVEYSLDLGLHSIPIAEGKSLPQIYYFDLVQQTNSIIHLLEKLYSSTIIAIVKSSPKYSDCIQKKRFVLEQIENKLDNGLEKSLNVIIGWIKFYLQSEQKKTDFRPESDVHILSSQACLTVVQQMTPLIEKIKKSLDGDNQSAFCTEFGIRFHRVVYEHLQQFTYDSAGAICVICDLNEYKKCASALNAPLVTDLFTVLHALCNLLLVKQENLNEVCSGETLAKLDESTVMNFIRLRSDNKEIRQAIRF